MTRMAARLFRICGVLAWVAGLFSLSACAGGQARPTQPAGDPPPQAAPVEFIGEWGVHGEAPGELAEPVGLAVDLSGRVYLADRRTGLVQKFEPGGVPLFSFEDRPVRSASSIAVDSGGAIYVADARAGRIWIYFPDGDLLRTFRVTPQPDAGSFGLSVAAGGTIFVPDAGGGRVQAFSVRGQLQRAWRVPAAPTGEAARPVAVVAGPDEFVYVGDAQTGRIVKYTSRGAQVAIWEAPAEAAIPLWGLAISRRHLFALRGSNPHAEVWTLDGVRILSQSLEATLETTAQRAVSFAVAGEGDLFLLDAARPRVLRFRIRIPSP
jgi:sugar lactone lactonase YvrE